jgi:hypothetical protein
MQKGNCISKYIHMHNKGLVMPDSREGVLWYHFKTPAQGMSPEKASKEITVITGLDCHGQMLPATLYFFFKILAT